MGWDTRLERRIRWAVVDAAIAPAAGTVGAVGIVDAEVYETVGDWNFTHNTSAMIYAALLDADVLLPPSARPCSTFDRETGEWVHWPDGHGCISWWDHFNGMSGAEGHFFLRVIIDGMEADPERFRALNPPNGWGDYDSLLEVLRAMRDACAVEDPTLRWWASG